MSGDPVDFSESDISAIATGYNPATMKSPLVLGHPKDNSPAYGWVQSLQFADGLLQAMPESVTPEFADWVNAGHYKTVSASLYAKNSSNNPTPGQFYLRHIGFLGGQPPAVKGLPPPEFSEPESDLLTFDFTEECPMPGATDEEQARLAADKAALEAQAAKLAKQEADFAEKEGKLNAEILALASEKATAQRADNLAFAEQLVKDGRLLPKDKPGLVEFMGSLKPEVVLEFGEGEAKTKTALLSWFKSFMTALPKAIEFGEMSGVDKTTGKSLTDEQIARRARAYHQKQTAAGEQISFTEAVDAVHAGLDLAGA